MRFLSWLAVRTGLADLINQAIEEACASVARRVTREHLAAERYELATDRAQFAAYLMQLEGEGKHDLADELRRLILPLLEAGGAAAPTPTGDKPQVSKVTKPAPKQLAAPAEEPPIQQQPDDATTAPPPVGPVPLNDLPPRRRGRPTKKEAEERRLLEQRHRQQQNGTPHTPEKGD